MGARKRKAPQGSERKRPSRRQEDVAAYLPTPEEIQAGCEAIQGHWSPREERTRAGRPRFDDRLEVVVVPFLGVFEGDGC